ncbi:hypothetical protein BJP44_08465 [Candidatus Williamhamiltonella defendens]|nr:hypothetical protein [Candidatus Hamiltonella defensa]ATW23040.1 hypothetical protein BJP44_08465 [Candidatus Hamiltonella defensa]
MSTPVSSLFFNRSITIKKNLFNKEETKMSDCFKYASNVFKNKATVNLINNISSTDLALEDLVARRIFSDFREYSNIKNEKEFMDILQAIIGEKYKIGNAELKIMECPINEGNKNETIIIKFELHDNKKNISTQGCVFFEKKSGKDKSSNFVEFKLTINDKRFLNKKSHLIDFFKNVFKRIFGYKTKFELINTKKNQ